MLYDQMPDRPPERPQNEPVQRNIRPDYDFTPTFYTPNLQPATQMDLLVPPAAPVWKGSDVFWITLVTLVIFFPILVGLMVSVTPPGTSIDETLIYTDPVVSVGAFLLETVSLIAAIYFVGLKRRGYNWKALGFFRTSRAWLLAACGIGVIFLPLNGIINLTVESIVNPEYARQLFTDAGLDPDNPFDFDTNNDFGGGLFFQTQSAFDNSFLNPTPFYFPTQPPAALTAPETESMATPISSTPVASSLIATRPLATGDPGLRPSRTPTPFPSATPFPSLNNSYTAPDSTSFGQRELLASSANTPLGIIGTLLLAGIAVPIAEEMFFRGVLFAWMRSKWGMWVGTIVSSLVFGLMHGPAGLVAATFVLGAICAILYENSRSLWPAIILHATNNLIVVLLQYTLIS